MCTASGQSAVFYAMLNILEAGDHFIFLFLCVWRYLQFVCPYIQKMGIEVTLWIKISPPEELKKRFVQIQKPSLLKPLQTPLYACWILKKFAALAKAAEAPLL